MEDLDPHRFEDLIRQLAYDFRTWSKLEPTGRLGADEGVDIRGLESITIDSESVEVDEDGQEASPRIEREWRIQCKRLQKLTPKPMREAVQGLVPDKACPPYGIVVAVAADVSAKTLQVVHEEAAKLGIREHHVWSRAVLEDMLFRPENDHLLFAYCGISLVARRRSRIAQVRAQLAAKRKVYRALEFDPGAFASAVGKSILVRDVADDRFPFAEDGHPIVPTHAPGAQMYDCAFEEMTPDGIWLRVDGYSGWIRPDGAWDYVKSTRAPVGTISERIREWRPEPPAAKPGETFFDQPLGAWVPDGEWGTFYLAFIIRFDRIIDVDVQGDPWFKGVHIIARFEGDDGPFEPDRFIAFVEQWRPGAPARRTHVVLAKRRQLYPRLRRLLDERAKAGTAPPSPEEVLAAVNDAPLFDWSQPPHDDNDETAR